jgi:glycosyltransferase involved in cell wall biosynthesis
MSCGLPVVATAVGGVPEQVSEGVTGYLVPPHDAAVMAERVGSLLDHPRTAEEMGNKAAATAQNKFNLETQIDRYLGWYEDVIRMHKDAS